MLKRNKTLFIIYFCLVGYWLLSGCTKNRVYTEYNYSNLEYKDSFISVNTALIGKFVDQTNGKREAVKGNPYYLRVGVLDGTSKATSAKIVNAKIIGHQSNQSLQIFTSTPQKRLSPSSNFTGVYAGFIATNLILKNENYDLIMSLELCENSNCKTIAVRGELRLEISQYKSNDTIDKYLSP